MHNSPHHLKHEKEKAIRRARQEGAEAKGAHRISEKQKKTYLTSPRVSKIARAKAASKHKHHLNIPGEMEGKVNPESLHQEGEHWAAHIQKKTLSAANRLRKKLQKFRLFNRKK